METINDHTLLPVLADWSSPVKTALAWQSDIAPAVRGNESRGAFRSTPRPTLSFTMDRGSVAENADLRARLLAGYQFTSGVPGANGRVGKFCVPWHGRASWTNAIDNGDTAPHVDLDPTPWPWAAGDYAIAFDDAGKWALFYINSVTGMRLGISTISNPAAQFQATGSAALYPIFYGRISLDDCPMQTLIHGDVPLEIVGSSYAISQAVPSCCPPEEVAPIYAGSFALCLALDETGSIGLGGLARALAVIDGYGAALKALGWVSFGDANVQIYAVTTDIAQARSDLEAQLAAGEVPPFFGDGGGDTPENGVDALWQCDQLMRAASGLSGFNRYLHLITDTGGFAHQTHTAASVLASVTNGFYQGVFIENNPANSDGADEGEYRTAFPAGSVIRHLDYSE